MLNSIRIFIISITIASFTFADVFMTELTDPQNSSDAGRYVELHNNGDSDVDLSSWAIQRWTNGNADPQSATPLTGSISAGGFYVICNDADKYSATYGATCDQDIGTGGAADSNGDDNVALLGADGSIVDMFGVPGEDGSGTGHEFEDGRAERAAGNACASATWDEAGWNIDNDSGGGDGNQYAPEGFDPGSWIGQGGDATECEENNDVFGCTDVFGLNYNPDATADDNSCEYADHQVEAGSMYFAPQDLVVEVGQSVQWNNVGGFHDAVADNGEFNFDACTGPCLIGSHTFTEPGTYDYICSVGSHADMGMVGTITVNALPDPENLFFSEHAEGSSNNKYFEVYNASDEAVSLDNYAFVNCSNGCDDWEYTNSFAEGATVAAGDVYVVCHSSADEVGIIPFCDETRTLYHNGDDAQGLMHVASNTLLDIIGAIGDDPGSGWEVAGTADATKDHTLVRKASVTTGNTDWTTAAGTNEDDSEWVVFAQNTWDYIDAHPHDFSSDVPGCTDTSACNYSADATVDDGSCEYPDVCGECDGDGTSCLVNVTFSVDMSIEGVVGDVKLRTSTINGEYNPSDWYVMDDSDGDLVYTYTLTLGPATYGYNFNNSDGNGYENGADLGECAGGNYGNDRYVTPGDTDLVLDAVCWESCEACPEVVYGCTDENALNYDENATEDDDSCIYEWPEVGNLFFSEYAEGSSNNKYLEIYNATGGDVDLSGYSLSSCSNGCNDGVSWDYPDNVTFDAGTIVASGDVYVVCHGSSDEFILAECDQTFTYLSNGDDVFALTQMGSGAILDIIGTIGDDPGSGWDVAGVSNATKDHTLVRASSVGSGNAGNWDASAGDEYESEWIVLDQNDWTFLGYHDMDTGGGDECGATGDVNGDTIVNVLDVVTLVNAIVAGTDVDCGDLNGDGILNVLDIVLLVGIITGARTADATEAILNNDNSTVSITANGYIGGVQMTLVHDSNFTIELTDNCLAANYVNHGYHTTLVIVEPNEELLFTANGKFEIKDLIVANSENEINITMINEFSLSNAYPNPFNPSTSFEVSVPEAGYLSVKVYDLSGKLVDTIADGVYNQSNYTFTWNAHGMPSGMYVINAEFNNTSISHNISLIK